MPPKARNLGQTWLEGFVAYASGECHLADNTISGYGRDIERFIAWAGDRSLPDLSVTDLSGFIEQLHDAGLAPASVARAVVAVRTFYRFLQLEGIVQSPYAELQVLLVDDH